MRSRGVLRDLKEQKIKKRRRLCNFDGVIIPLCNKRHIEKLEVSEGYLAKHGSEHKFCRLNNRKVRSRSRNRFHYTENWKARDVRKFDSMLDQEIEYGNQENTE